ncbi:ATP-binding protein [Embleya sp. NPDC020630]|uniref:ATP-binding protein n=1 Tax=Embleya sp. NPDC020630 TaxID=3363979 RepID=UPI00379A8EFC
MVDEPPASPHLRETIRWNVPPEPGALRLVRHAVRDSLTDWGWTHERVHTAMWVTSELVGNALRHTDAGAVLTLTPIPDGVRLTVTDTSPDPPVRRTPGPDGGHGLRVLDTLAPGWSVEHHPHGKSIHVDIRT